MGPSKDNIHQRLALLIITKGSALEIP